jgi:hypothetical protein
MMKILDYERVNGSADRDDTALVAQIIPTVEEVGRPQSILIGVPTTSSSLPKASTQTV